MQIGSIVVIKKLPPVESENAPLIKWWPVDDEKTPYQIRELILEDTQLANFEEGVIGYNREGREFALPTKYMREILPPEDISEKVEEMMLQPVEK